MINIESFQNKGLEATAMIVACAVATYFFPWWSVAVATGLVALVFNKNSALSYGFGAAAGLLVWGAFAYYFDTTNGNILTNRLAGMFQLSNGAYLVGITTFIGSQLTGMGALTGATFRRIFEK